MTPAYYQSIRQRLLRLETAIAEITAETPANRTRQALLAALQRERDALLTSVPQDKLQQAGRRG
jgi:hypothetical protein